MKILFLVNIILLIRCAYTSDECSRTHEPKLLRSCCKIPYTDEVIKKCANDLKKPKSKEPAYMAKMRKNKVALHICVAECEFKAKGYLLDVNTIDVNVIRKDLSQRYPNDSDYVQLFQKSLASCSDFARNKTNELSWLKSEGNCNFFPSILLGCVYEQILKDCPVKKWQPSSKCEELKNFLVKCDILKSTKN